MSRKNPSVLWTVEQGLESEEKAQARSNIGVEDAISDAINALDKAEVGEAGKYVEKIKEDNGIITATLATMNTSIMDVTDTTALKKAPTTGAVKTAIENLDVPATGTGAITGFGANKTLATLSETDGKIAATFQNIALGNITHEGKIGTEANKVIVTGANGVLTTGATDGDYNSSSNKIATQSTVSGAIGNLNNSDSAVTNQFVTSVSEAAGIISVTRAQPTIGDLAAVASSKKNYSIGTNSSDGTIEAQNLTVSSATDGGDSDDLTFVSSVTQASNGKISVTTKKVPYSIQFIDTDYSYDDVLELIAAGKYPVVRYESGYDILYLPMFTSPRSSGTYIEFRGFAKSADNTIYKIVCDPETGFGELTSASFVSTSETSNFLDNITYDAATADNQHGSITLKYHKYGGASTYTSVLTLRGDLDTGIAIRNVASQTPPMYKIINQRPIPTYTATHKDRILSVNSAGTGLEWRTLTSPSIQYKDYGGSPTDVSTLLINADDPDGYVDLSVDGSSKGSLVAGPYQTLLNSGINGGSGVGDTSTPIYIKDDGTFDTCLTSSDVEFIQFSYSNPNPQDDVYAAIEAARTNNRLPVIYCGIGSATAYWIFSGHGITGYSFSRTTNATCSRATIDPNHVFTIEEQVVADGDVIGPSASTDSHIPLFDGTTGKLLKDSQFHFSTYAMSTTGTDVQYVKTKSYYDVFPSSQQILSNTTNNTVLYIGNQHRLIRLGIDGSGNVVLSDQNESRTQGAQYEYTLNFDYSPSTSKTIIGSSGTGNSTTYNFYGVADKASKINTSYAIGANNQPVYVASDGTVTACDFKVVIGSLPTSTDTIAFL